MTRFSLSRLRRVDTAELLWRARQMSEIAATRALARISPPRWDRRHLGRRLSATAGCDAIRTALAAGRWHDAHVAVADFLHTQPERFVIAPRLRGDITAAIAQRFPEAAGHARERGERLIAGRYEVLGYRDLPFDGRRWHDDPVHHATAPLVFWSDVPYLDESCGDHKVTWEFNRHQHWIELGRAFWLTGDARFRTECLRQLDTWLEANPPLTGINWASMLELGFRSISWIWAAHFFASDAAYDSSPWLVDLLLGVDRQLHQIERHLSYYFSPNTHLLGEALALYVGGHALPMLADSPRRIAVGRQVLLHEIGRQIAADGGHCERSAHYHRYTLDFYLLALAVARVTNDAAMLPFERACGRLAHAARLLADDNGLLPLIGDDDGGMLLPITQRRRDDVRDSLAIAAALTGGLDLLVDAPPEEVWWLLGHERFAEGRHRIEHAPHPLAAPSAALASTGYYISRNDSGDHAIIDGGPHGYLNGGHAHADALSLTFTHRRQPLAVDTGTGAYTIAPHLRDRFRSTAMHNTLTLDGRPQSSPRGPFHWQQTVDATTRRWRSHRRFDYFVGLHDGYAPLRHVRHVLVVHDDLLLVADCLIEPGADEPPRCTHSTAASVHWHLHPQWSAHLDGSLARLRAGTTDLTLHVLGGELEQFVADEANGLGWFAPVYGRIEATTTLRVSATCRAPHWFVSVFTLDPANATMALALDEVAVRGRVAHHATAVRIDRTRGVDRLVIAEPVDGAHSVRWHAAGVEADAPMLLTREREGQLTAVAVVDATSVSARQHPELERSMLSFVSNAAAGSREDTDRRKAS